MKYNYYEDLKNKTVICTTHYAGKIVKAKAKCAPEDSYSMYVGAQIAKARVDKKVAEKKIKDRRNKWLKAMQECELAERKKAAAYSAWIDAIAEDRTCFENLYNLIGREDK